VFFIVSFLHPSVKLFPSLFCSLAVVSVEESQPKAAGVLFIVSFLHPPVKLFPSLSCSFWPG